MRLDKFLTAPEVIEFKKISLAISLQAKNSRAKRILIKSTISRKILSRGQNKFQISASKKRFSL